MSQDIMTEVTFLLHAICLGIIITFVYDWLIIFRRILRHSMWLVSIEDLFFWICCAVLVFQMLYQENNGILRWFAVAGATFGMLIYKKTISNFFVHMMFVVFTKIIYLVIKMGKIIWKPFGVTGKKIRCANRFFIKKTNKIGRIVKKKLTNGLKLLKITLCKH